MTNPENRKDTNNSLIVSGWIISLFELYLLTLGETYKLMYVVINIIFLLLIVCQLVPPYKHVSPAFI